MGLGVVVEMVVMFLEFFSFERGNNGGERESFLIKMTAKGVYL